MEWDFPLGLGGVNADQVQGLTADLAVAVRYLSLRLPADWFSPTVSPPVAPDLSAFLDTQAATQTVLLLLFVSMIVVGIAVILVASWSSAWRWARRTVMGHERPTGFVLAEVMPAVLAAVVAGAVCALVLPHLIGSALDLSGYTGAAIPVQLQPDLITLALPAAFFLLIAAAALVTETRTLRRRAVTGMLRAN
jgi:putative ABC transport system permease protein